MNGRDYRYPRQPVVVICYDGCDQRYIDAAIAQSIIPNMQRMMEHGFAGSSLATMPTFTNPNNVSIVCGAPPSVHGVSGNYYLDRETRREVMMLDATLLRAPTILSSFSHQGAQVVAITAKDKLRKVLGHEMLGIAFSAQHADTCTLEENGIENVEELVGRPAPMQYDADLSLFVLDAGVRLLETRGFGLAYLSLSDYVQHAHAPGTPEANAFMAAVDVRLGRLAELGAIVGIVADHGMSDMADADGAPKILYLGDALDETFGKGATRVICPITDPFVRHHGALGGFVRVHFMQDGLDAASVLDFIASRDGVALALPGPIAAQRFDLPADREADIVVIAERGVALGAGTQDHDLSQLAGTRLRSHGGLEEQPVPFIVSHSLSDAYAERAKAQPLHNFDIFDFVLNGVEV
ncbi:phosphonoacetate hydrolase [Billgrantia endophytica]|uniref:phosphonoacetate hydrolase n=1 Tax=Billgrantia endophytica TaxID=2033802 RepID=UPI00197A88CD|nr:phosphonoacetate hydrolase [Halomonas endophytica]